MTANLVRYPAPNKYWNEPESINLLGRTSLLGRGMLSGLQTIRGGKTGRRINETHPEVIGKPNIPDAIANVKMARDAKVNKDFDINLQIWKNPDFSNEKQVTANKLFKSLFKDEVNFRMFLTMVRKDSLDAIRNGYEPLSFMTYLNSFIRTNNLNRIWRETYQQRSIIPNRNKALAIREQVLPLATAKDMNTVFEKSLAVRSAALDKPVTNPKQIEIAEYAALKQATGNKSLPMPAMYKSILGFLGGIGVLEAVDVFTYIIDLVTKDEQNSENQATGAALETLDENMQAALNESARLIVNGIDQALALDNIVDQKTADLRKLQDAKAEKERYENMNLFEKGIYQLEKHPWLLPAIVGGAWAAKKYVLKKKGKK